MTNDQILSAFNESVKEIKRDIAEVSEKLTRVNTILEGAGDGGIIGDLKRVERKVDKLESEFREDIDTLKRRMWQLVGGISVVTFLAGFLLPKILG
jgi:uncharacterized protein Yka (UPF0111/DUF47 family)